MMIGVSKWKYSQSAIDERQDACNDFGDPSDFCKNEAWFIRELSQQLQDKFDIRRNLTFAFMESYSQSGQTNLNDEVQQNHWIVETKKLWSEATSRNETFDFKTIDEVLEENAQCKEENNRLYDIISEDIKQLMENVTILDKNFIRNEEKITYCLSSMVLLTKDVEELTEEVSGVQDNVVSVAEDVQQNTAHISTVNKELNSLKEDVLSLNDDFGSLVEDLGTLNDDVVSLKDSDQQQDTRIESLASSDKDQEAMIGDNTKKLESLATRGTRFEFIPTI